jgi:hypothetical protein
MIKLIKILYVHDIWLTLPFGPWKYLFVFKHIISDLVNIYLRSSILLVLVSGMSMLLTSWRH